MNDKLKYIGLNNYGKEKLFEEIYMETNQETTINDKTELMTYFINKLKEWFIRAI